MAGRIVPQREGLWQAESARSPEVVRERLSHLGDGRVSGTLIFDREFSGREVSRFYAQRSDGDLNPGDFQLAGRVLQYECPEADEPRWRLAAEIYLVKSFETEAGRTSRPRPAPGGATRRGTASGCADPGGRSTGSIPSAACYFSATAPSSNG